MHFIFFAENENANLHNLKMLQSEINLQTVTATAHLPKNILSQKNKAKKIKTKTKNKKKTKWDKWTCKNLADKIECAA